MSRANMINIEHLQVNRAQLEKAKKRLNAKSDTEAIRKALTFVSRTADKAGERMANGRRSALSKIKDIAVETGLQDLAVNHDHYLYGVEKEA